MSAAATAAAAAFSLSLTATPSLIGEASAAVAKASVVVPNCGCYSAFMSYGIQTTLSRSFPCCRADYARSFLGNGVLPPSWQRDRPLLPVSPTVIASERRRSHRILVAASSAAALQAAASLRISPSDCSSTSSRNRRTRLFCSANHNTGNDFKNMLTDMAMTSGTTPTTASATVEDEVCVASKSSRGISPSSWKLEVDDVALGDGVKCCGGSDGSDGSSSAVAAAADVGEEEARADLEGTSVGVRLQRRNQVDSTKLKIPGQDNIPFEFSDEREVRDAIAKYTHKQITHQ